MRLMRWTMAATLVALLAALPNCNCDPNNTTPGKDSGPLVWVDASRDAIASDRVATDRASGDSAPGSDRLIDTPDPDDPANATKDSDCDGLSDAEEFGNRYGGGRQTDPGNPDSDGDGLADGVEVGRTGSPDVRCASLFVGDADPTSHTDPTAADSDRDGLCDGPRSAAGCAAGEDASGDGRYDVGQELDPHNPDTDHDGRCDGPNNVAGFCTGGDPNPYLAVADTDNDGVADEIEQASACLEYDDPDSDGDGLCDGPRDVAGVCVGGEDLNGDGVLGSGETDPCHVDTDCDGSADQDERDLGLNPRKKDTDGDLVSDGIELCRTSNLDPGYCTTFVAAGTGCQPTDPVDVDSDGDGIHDGVEDADRDGVVDSSETDPNNADSDGDGMCDGPTRNIAGVCAGGEDLNANGVVDTGETDPRAPGTASADGDHDGVPDSVENGSACLSASDPDTDDDGLCDGPLAVAGVCAAGEDLNHNGRVESGETDPCKIDSDCDGLVDGLSYGLYLGEVTIGTNPTNPDTDGDGLTDGLEASVGAASMPAGDSAACGFVADFDPTSGTDPIDADSDGDGVADGAEDADQNGRVDSGELNPNANDAAGPAAMACSADRLVPIDRSGSLEADLTVVTANYGGGDAFAERSTLQSNGDDVGLMLFNATHQVAAFALNVPPTAAEVTAQAAEQARRPVIGNLTDSLSQTFTSWDGYAGSVLVSYNDSATSAVKTRANDIVTRLLGGAPTGLLTTGGDSGPFKLQLEYVRRSDHRLVIVGVLIAASRYTGSALFRANDLANGSALAQYPDSVGAQCDLLEVHPTQAVDFVLVVDNSGSMENEQNAVAAAADAIGGQLSSSTVDWRVAVITTDTDGHTNALAEWQHTAFPQTVYNISRIDDDGYNGAVRVTTSATTNWVANDRVKVFGTTNYNGNWKVYQVAGSLTAFTDANGASDTPAETTGTVARSVQYCPFTTAPADIRKCMINLGTQGDGEENHFRSFACAMGKVVTGAGINTNLNTAAGEKGGAADGESCGRDSDRAPFPGTSTFQTPPGTFVFLPRADNNATRVRTGARVAVIFVTDANDQSDGRYDASGDSGPYAGDAIATHSIPAWQAYFGNFDGLGSELSRTFVAGLVCPVGANCTDEGTNGTELYSNPRFRTFFTGLGGIEAELPPDGDPNQAQKIGDAIRTILQHAIAQASPYTLRKAPISSTIRIATDAHTAGACDTNNIPRSRQNGFDYDGATNSIQFFGNCRPLAAASTKIAVSYRYWIDRTPNPDGAVTECVCTPPEVCDPLTLECYCPPDCGLGTVPPEKVCDTATCTLVCRADCGASCPGNSVCNPAPAVCACECPRDCGGPAPGSNFVCDRAPANPTYCGYVCSSCPGTPPNPDMTCDLAACTWRCPACGSCPGLAHCDTSTCECACDQSMSCGAGYRWDSSACDCVCDAAQLACEPRYIADTQLCGCVCRDNCGDTCDESLVCNQSLCTCVPRGG